MSGPWLSQFVIPVAVYYPIGAAGDGITDDTAAIQNAINAANAAGGGTVWLAAKTYYIPGGLVAKAGVKLLGQGWVINSGGTLTGGTILLGNNTNPGISYNATDLGAQPTLVAVQNAALYGFRVEGIGLTTFTYGIKLGALYNTSIWYGGLRNIMAQNCSQWQIYVENASLSEFKQLYCNNVLSTSVGGILFCGSTSNYNQGNSIIYDIFADVSLGSLSRGLVFQARGGSVLNDLSVSSIQCNQSSSKSTVTQAATMTNASANITVTDSTQFPVDMPVTVDATANGFTKYKTYFVLTSAANVITLSNTMRGPAVNATGNTAVNILCFGFPPIEICGLGTGDAANNQIQPSHFDGIDSEGKGTTMLLVQLANIDLDIGTLSTGQGTANASSICGRSASGQWRCVSAATVDLDSSSNKFFSIGANIQTDSFPLTAIVDKTPQGLYFDRSTSTIRVAMGGRDYTTTIPSVTSTTNNTVGAVTFGSNWTNGVVFRGGVQTGNWSDTTAAAASIINAAGNPIIGQRWYFTYVNNSSGGFTATLLGGSGVTISGTATIAPSASRTFLVDYTGAGAITMTSISPTP